MLRTLRVLATRPFGESTSAWWMVLNGSYVSFGLCVIENIFWKTGALYHPSWNNLSIYLLWLQSSSTNINVLQIMRVPVRMKPCIWPSMRRCRLEHGLLSLTTHTQHPGPDTGWALCWPRVVCVSTADVQTLLQPQPRCRQERTPGARCGPTAPGDPEAMWSPPCY